MGQRRWVYVRGVTKDGTGEKQGRRQAPAGRQRFVLQKRGDPATENRLVGELRKQVEQLSPEERQELRERFAPARRVSKSTRPGDLVAEAGIREMMGTTRVLEMEKQDGRSTLVGGGEVTRLDLSQSVRKGERKGYLDAISDVTPAPPDAKPDTKKLG